MHIKFEGVAFNEYHIIITLLLHSSAILLPSLYIMLGGQFVPFTTLERMEEVNHN